MNFEQLLETELADVDKDEQLNERSVSGSVDAFSQSNKFKSVTLPGGEVLVSVSNRSGEVGTITINPGSKVEYTDSKGKIVSRESVPKYGVTMSSLKNYYVPKLLNDTMTDDMFGVFNPPH